MTSGAGSTTSGVVSGSLGSREINYILRVLGPAACRNPDVFTETANSCVRIALPAPRGAGTGTCIKGKHISLSFCFVLLLPLFSYTAGAENSIVVGICLWDSQIFVSHLFIYLLICLPSHCLSFR